MNKKSTLRSVANDYLTHPKSTSGITLIALVVTIIVLLILAGISIAMLTGDNGVITNAAKSATASAYYGAEEHVKLAQMAVDAEIVSQTIKNGKYDATKPNNTKKLAQVVEKDLNGSKWKVDGTDAGFIKIRYTDSAIDKGIIDGTIPEQEGYVDYLIKLEKQSSTLEGDKTGLTIAENPDNTPDDEGQEKTVAELYDGINNPNDENYDENAMHIGDFINYDAGIWSETKAIPTSNRTFGGYQENQSRNTNAIGIENSIYEGWRIWDISEGVITIVSAGCTELCKCSTWDSGYGGSLPYEDAEYLTGHSWSSWEQVQESRDWSMYMNNYATNADFLEGFEISRWLNKYCEEDEWGPGYITRFVRTRWMVVVYTVTYTK